MVGECYTMVVQIAEMYCNQDVVKNSSAGGAAKRFEDDEYY